jgi:hypothetical protein
VEDDGSVLSSDSATFLIKGKGFDALRTSVHTFTLSGNVKALLGSNAKSTRTSLEISFTHLAPSDEGVLEASVTVDTSHAGTSAKATTIVAAHPFLNSVTNDVLSSDSALLTVKGLGFDALNSTANVMSMKDIDGPGDEVKGLIGLSAFKSTIASTTTSMLQVSFTHLAPTNAGPFLAYITVSDEYSSSAQLTKIVAANPSITSSTLNDLSSDSEKLTIDGKGFDAINTNANVVSFVSPTFGPDIKAFTSKLTLSRLIMTFTHLSPSNHDSILQGAITVSDVWSSLGANLSKIVRADVSLQSSGDTLSSDSGKLSIKGKGFDASQSTDNTVAFTIDQGAEVKALVSKGDDNIATTMTRLVMSFTHLAPTNNDGNLLAKVVVSALTTDGPTQQAKIVAANPSLPGVPISIITPTNMNNGWGFEGRGFDATSPSNNVVIFNVPDVISCNTCVEGTVVKSTMTFLTISFKKLNAKAADSTSHSSVRGSSSLCLSRFPSLSLFLNTHTHTHARTT